jgi:hypothetical protein
MKSATDEIRQWEEAIAQRVHATMAAAEMDRYFNVKMTASRARIALLQLSLFVSCRRDCWANLIANCDAPEIRRRLMEHEYDELVEDEYSSKGHYDLIVRQGALIGLTGDDFAKVQPLRTTAWRPSTVGSGSQGRRLARRADRHDGDRMGKRRPPLDGPRRGLVASRRIKMDSRLRLQMGGNAQLCDSRRGGREARGSVRAPFVEICPRSKKRVESSRRCFRALQTLSLWCC